MRFFSLLAVTLASLVFSFSARAENRISPVAFLGDYDLVAQREGLLCDEHMHAMQEAAVDGSGFLEISLGAFSFLGVNNGPQRFTDSLGITTSLAYTTSDGRMVYESKDVSTSNHETTNTLLVARLAGSRLTIVSQSVTRRPGSFPLKASFQCVYRKLASPK